MNEYVYTPEDEPDADSCQFRHPEGFCENEDTEGYILITEAMPGVSSSGVWVPGCVIHAEVDEVPEGETIKHLKNLHEARSA